jgi:hypothetical protein
MADIADAEELCAADESTIVAEPDAWTDPFYGFKDDRIIDDIPDDIRYINEKLFTRVKKSRTIRVKQSQRKASSLGYWARWRATLSESQLPQHLQRGFSALVAILSVKNVD